MENPLISQKLRGNKNAAGKHIRRFGASVAKTIRKVAPKKVGALSSGLDTAKKFALDPTVPAIGGLIGVRKGIISNKLAASMGMKTSKHVVKKAALRGALTATRANLPLAIAAGTAVAGAKAVQRRRAAKRSVGGRIKTAAAAIKKAVKRTINTIKG